VIPSPICPLQRPSEPVIFRGGKRGGGSFGEIRGGNRGGTLTGPPSSHCEPFSGLVAGSPDGSSTASASWAARSHSRYKSHSITSVNQKQASRTGTATLTGACAIRPGSPTLGERGQPQPISRRGGRQRSCKARRSSSVRSSPSSSTTRSTTVPSGRVVGSSRTSRPFSTRARRPHMSLLYGFPKCPASTQVARRNHQSGGADNQNRFATWVRIPNGNHRQLHVANHRHCSVTA
jgi:hypothetical protein